MKINLLSLGVLATTALAKTVTYDFNVEWVKANPDGHTDRKVIGINGQWPLPRIEVDKGDRLVVNMHNGLGDQNASIHFHGMYQNGTTHMDGPPGLVQCPVPPGQNFTYNFTVDQNGTYWYHSHVGSQYPDGYRAPLIVHDKNAPYEGDYDEELTVTLSDWYHELIENIDPDFLSLYNPSGAEPVPQAMLFNESQRSSIPVEPNKTYLLHIINIGAFSSQYFYIEDHDMEIVEVDGVYTERKKTDLIYITAAQRYTVLVKTKDNKDKNYPIVTIFDSSLFDVIPSDLGLNQTNWLEYDKSKDHPEAKIDVEISDDLEPFDDMELVPYDHKPLLPEPDHTIEITVTMNNLLDGINYAFFNNITYTAPKVPTLYTVKSAKKSDISDARIYGDYTHTYVLKKNEVVEVILNNADDGTHPFHLHGHEFQVIERSDAFDDPTEFDPNNRTDYPKHPMRRDTVYVNGNGYMVFRFVADNPGVWFFHCHIEWHLSQGLALVFVEAPEELYDLDIPQQHYDVCKAAGVPTEGNAAANTKDFFNLEGQNKQTKDLPPGFTARGIVALVFSCVSAFLGMAAIAYYGLSDLSASDEAILEHEGINESEVEQYRDYPDQPQQESTTNARNN
ncbi:hypothetical protein TRICI_006678 [Trichomonascus ciferrii]|uniref:Iron transport multicopper oxidase FET3 n=1 Tax=Trichomonascus ciferrii TaxID=44093 RepID=A0A642UEQ9_9ASCO|nr:hypothetical protein TRICI_006678 [Trichomonascus ciferrii]